MFVYRDLPVGYYKWKNPAENPFIISNQIFLPFGLCLLLSNRYQRIYSNKNKKLEPTIYATSILKFMHIMGSKKLFHFLTSRIEIITQEATLTNLPDSIHIIIQ